MGDAKTSCDRRAHLLHIEFLALDGAGADYLAREALKVGLSSKMKAKALHLSEKPSLLMSNLSQ